MSVPVQRGEFSPSDRIAAFAKATEVYAESLDDPDLANIYWGKSLGLRQAIEILCGDGSDPASRGRYFQLYQDLMAAARNSRMVVVMTHT